MLRSGPDNGDLGIRPGIRIGRYEILSALGSGGMGEVWKARDTTLNRDVAIKALPEALAADGERLRRLEREAQLLASLNHPNIAAIHGIESWAQTRVLVLELVDGVTLAERLLQGAMPIATALPLALEIAAAVEAAHERGIVHRDLKPANIMVTADGRLKILDFGIAKAIDPATDDSLRKTTIATEPGAVIGTPDYMSPEQVRGETIDNQSDIWSCGVVLYELLTGRSPFRGRSTADTFAQVLGTEPDYSALPPETPARIRQTIRRCLEKDRRRRLQDIGDMRIELEEALAAPAEATPGAAQMAPRPGTAFRNGAMLAGAALAGAVLIGVAGWFAGQRSGAPEGRAESIALSIPFVDAPSYGPVAKRMLAISHDGSRVAYASGNRVWIRRLDRNEPLSIAESGTNPFFSPDGAWVAFFSDLELVKVPVDGGVPFRITTMSSRSAGATWSTDGTIVFATTEGLHRVSANGGEATLLIRPDPRKKERLLAWPHFLADGQSLLFTIVPLDTAEATRIAFMPMASRESRVIVSGGTAPVFVRPRHLVYASGSALNVVEFDPATGEIGGAPVPVPGVEVYAMGDIGAADFAVAQSGTLVYHPVGDSDGSADLRTLTWIDRQGREEPILIKAGRYNYARISPDGTLVALDVGTAGARDVWILSLSRLTLTRLTDGPTEDLLPVWSADGQRVYFASDRTGNFDVYSQSADGAGGVRVELANPNTHIPSTATADGRGLILAENFRDISVLGLDKPTGLRPLLRSKADERLGGVSPDGNLLAYESDESGERFEVFVRPFPDTTGGREQVSVQGGRFPRWSRGGTELTYVNLEGEMMAVAVTQSPALALGRPTRLFQWQKPQEGRGGMPYDISPVDGRFLVSQWVERRRDRLDVSVVLNFLAGLRDQSR